MRDMRDEGRTVLFVSHDLTSVRQLCNRAVLLVGGRVTPTASLTRSPGATSR
jgi:lipopolysaccharide transport system ATP-binding protein